jgi:O-glycosyl hydrolase
LKQLTEIQENLGFLLSSSHHLKNYLGFPMWSLKSNSTALAVALNGIVALGQTITVNPSTTYQTIDGFGFSEAFGFGAPIASASASIQTQVTNYLFSTTTGAGLTILRNRIAAGSGSIEPNAPSGPNAQPTYTWDGNDAGQVWFSLLE